MQIDSPLGLLVLALDGLVFGFGFAFGTALFAGILGLLHRN
jgi:hypothetical protein